MLIFLKAQLAYLATPKTGSTAIELALGDRADIIFRGTRKHMPAQRYRAKVAPFLNDTFKVTPASVAMMRAPIDQLSSWYRYRSRAEKMHADQSTNHISFDEFVLAALSEQPPEFAKIGSQFKFVSTGKGKCVVNHLFSYDAQPKFITFMQDCLGSPINLEKRNVSPQKTVTLSPNVEAYLREKRADEFALFDRLTQSGGYLKS